jgi:FkbM family methyltransferase
MIIKILQPLIEKFPKIAAAYRIIRDERKINQDPKITPMGFKFIGNTSMEEGKFELRETGLIKKILPKVDWVINVGANIGFYVCIALQEEKRVIAFEPLNSNIKYLLKNINANNWNNFIEIYPVALSDKVGINKIFGSGTGASLIPGWSNVSKKKSSLIPCLTLDLVAGERLRNVKTLIIIDIEGYEKPMLDGAEKLLNNNPKPIWIVEITVKEHQPNKNTINPNLLKTFEKFWESNYSSYAIDDKIKKIKKGEIEKIVKTGNDTLMTHNFIFIDKNLSIDSKGNIEKK